MKAAVVSSFTAPLEIMEREIPEPGPDQVLVRLEACGLCHTDIHAAHGDWPVKPGLPFVPGHEGVGIVEKIGARRHQPFHRRARGDPVARIRVRRVPLLHRRARDTLRAAAQQRLLRRRRIRRIRRRERKARRDGSGRRELAGCRTAHVRRGDDVQGPQGREHRSDGTRRRLRNRRPRPPRRAVCAHHGRIGHRRRHRGAEARAGPRTRRATTW